MSPSPKHALIITADDYGYSPERNKGIVEAFTKGGVTRTSLMVNAGAAEEGVVLAKKNGLPLGLHLNLSEGLPVSDPCHVRTLLNEDGLMLGKLGFPESVNQGRINLKEVQVEIDAQLERFHKLAGQYPLYVDGHQHVHIVPGVCEIFSKSLVQCGVRETRLPVELDFDKCDWLIAPQKAFFQKVVDDSLQAAEVFHHHGIRFTHSFVGLSTMGANMNSRRLKEGILSALHQQKFLPYVTENNKMDKQNISDKPPRGDSSNITLSCEGMKPINASCDVTESVYIHSCDHCTNYAAAADYSRQNEKEEKPGENVHPLVKCQQDLDLSNMTNSPVTTTNDHLLPMKPQGSFITCELMVHPGYPSHSGDPGCGGGVDSFSQSPERLEELQIITSADMLDFYKEKNLYLIKTLI